MITAQEALLAASCYRQMQSRHQQAGCPTCATVFEIGALASSAAFSSARYGWRAAQEAIGDTDAKWWPLGGSWAAGPYGKPRSR